MVDSANRCYGNQGKFPSRILFSQQTGPSGLSRWFGLQLETEVHLPVPSSSIAAESSEENQRGKALWNSDCPILALQDMISSLIKSVEGGLSITSLDTKPLSPERSSPPRSSEATSHILDDERSTLEKSGLSNSVINNLLVPRRPFTNKVYNREQKIFSAWCSTKKFLLQPFLIYSSFFT